MASKKVQQKTGVACRQSIIDLLNRAAGDDETNDYLVEVCLDLECIDTSMLDVDTLMNDRRVKAAFRGRLVVSGGDCYVKDATSLYRATHADSTRHRCKG